MSLLLSIAADLSAPPSSPSCFRDVTLQASILGYRTVSVCELEMIDPYHKWFKERGLYDYVEELVPDPQLVAAVQIIGGIDARLTAHNLHLVLGLLRRD